MNEPPAPAPAATLVQRRVQGRARLRDALRLLPFLGLAVFILPDLVLSGGPASEGATGPWLTYLLVAWGLLIAIAFVLARAHGRSDPADPADAPDD